MGVPWTQKFDGKKNGIKCADWSGQMKALLRAQGLSEQQKIDFILTAIEGDATREVQLLEEENRNTADKIFDFLNQLYGRVTPVADLRMRFFNMRQNNGETFSEFSLRMREAFQQWKAAEPEGSARQESTLRDQMINGLQIGPLKKELQRQMHRNPDLTCDELFQEVKELEKEGWNKEVESQSCQVTAAPSVTDLTQWKDQTRAELVQLVSELGDALKDELRKCIAHKPTSGRRVQEPYRRASPRPHWDEQGRPICLHCSQPGHLRRECPQRQQTQVPLNPQVRPL